MTIIPPLLAALRTCADDIGRRVSTDFVWDVFARSQTPRTRRSPAREGWSSRANPALRCK